MEKEFKPVDMNALDEPVDDQRSLPGLLRERWLNEARDLAAEVDQWFLLTLKSDEASWSGGSPDIAEESEGKALAPSPEDAAA